MTDLSLSYLAFGLALIVGGMCYLLVKHTADEFDRWYESPRLRRLHFPATAFRVLAVAALITLIAR